MFHIHHQNAAYMFHVVSLHLSRNKAASAQTREGLHKWTAAHIVLRLNRARSRIFDPAEWRFTSSPHFGFHHFRPDCQSSTGRSLHTLSILYNHTSRQMMCDLSHTLRGRAPHCRPGVKYARDISNRKLASRHTFLRHTHDCQINQQSNSLSQCFLGIGASASPVCICVGLSTVASMWLRA